MMAIGKSAKVCSLFNPFSPTLFLIVAKISLPNRSQLTFEHSGAHS